MPLHCSALRLSRGNPGVFLVFSTGLATVPSPIVATAINVLYRDKLESILDR